MRPEDIDISAIGSADLVDTTLRLPLGRADLAYVCMCIDELLGRRVLPASGYDAQALLRDRLRCQYVVMVAQLMRDTRLGDDLPMLFRYLMARAKGRNETPDGHQLGMDRRIRKRLRLPFRDEEALRSYIVWYAAHCPFEPAWHRDMRGDARRMRNTFPGNEWSWLVRAYTDPDAYDREEPEHIQRARRRTKGYARCLDSARSDALAELRRRYGPGYGRSGAGQDRLMRDVDHRALMSMEEVLSGEMPF